MKTIGLIRILLVVSLAPSFVSPVEAAFNNAPAWVRTYDGLAHRDDYIASIAVGKDGSVYVTGSSQTGSAERALDIVTIAYSNDGNLRWVRQYDGPGHGIDEGVGIAVGEDGNVYVTGSSAGTGGYPLLSPDSSRDFVTIGYSSAGIPLWTNRYNGPIDDFDGPSSIAVDNNNQVYVTGGSRTSRTNSFSSDFVTVAYSGSGVPLWTNLYNGPGNLDDYVTSVAVDGSGHVYVSGQSTGITPDYRFPNTDIATICYSSAGDVLWTRRFGRLDTSEFPTSLAVGLNQRIYVSGYSSSTNTPGVANETIAIAYSSNGQPIWTNRFIGGGALLTLDPLGNVYFREAYFLNGTNGLDGLGWRIVSYSEAGIATWTNRVETGEILSADKYGNLYARGTLFSGPGGSVQKIFTGAYSPKGILLWTNLYDAQGAASSSIAIDMRGNLFVGGFCVTNNYRDYCLIKYSPLLYIVTQPSDLEVPSGSNAIMQTDLNGVPPFAYQWYFDGAAVSDATNSILSISNVTSATQGSYRVVVTNSFGNITSEVALLTVVPPPNIVTAPADTLAGCGDIADFQVAADGRPPLTYLWRFGGAPISDATNSSLLLNRVTLTKAGAYDVVVSNLGGSVTSTVAMLTVRTDVPPVIVVQPRSGLSNINSRFSLSVEATSCLPVSYQWFFNDHPLVGATGTVIRFNFLAPSDAGDYTVKVCNEAGCVTSDAAVVAVNYPPIPNNDGGVTIQHQPIVFTTAQLLANDFDPDGDPLTVADVGPASFYGAVVSKSSTNVTYAPPSGFFGPDRFSYRVSDGRGGLSTGFVEIFVFDGVMPLPDYVSIAVYPGGIRVRFIGTPGEQYRLQRSATLRPATWIDLRTFIAPAHGVIEYTDSANLATAFLRVVSP